MKQAWRIFVFSITILVWYFSAEWLHNSIHLLFMITLGHWGFTTNLDILYRVKIDALSLLKHVPGYQVSNSYGIAMFMSIVCCIFSYLTGLLNETAAPFALALIFFFWIQPFKLYRIERQSILEALYRSIVITKVDLSQVILCDILTSYSRIMCQMTLETVWFVFPSNKISYYTNRGKLSSKMDVIVPILIAIPYIMRLRQCLAEAKQSKDDSLKRAHYANAVKYLTSLPVIFTGHFMSEWEIAAKNPNYKPHEWNHGTVFWIWYIRLTRVVVLLLNTAYSLYWDICMDWHLCGHLAIIPRPVSQNKILRPHLHFRYPILYYLAIIFNSVFRFAWLLRLWFLGVEPTIALDVTLALIEIFRRWVWVFFRLEREWVLHIPSGAYNQVQTDEN